MRKSIFPSILSVVLVIALILGVVFWLNPLRSEIAGLKAERDEAKENLEEQKASLTGLKVIQEELPISEAEQESLERAVPTEADQDSLITDLSETADEAGISLNSINFNLGEKEDFKTVNISANFSGNYEDLLNFLTALEQNERKIQVKSISVQLGETNASGQEVSFNLNMEAYYQ